MDENEIRKHIEIANERNRNWLKELPIIKEIVEFPDDKSSSKLCNQCVGNCCFFDKMIICTNDGRYDFRLDGLEKLYKDFKIIKKNSKNKCRMYSEDTIDWRRCWAGNSAWGVVVKWSGGISVGYACPMLNEKMRCSIYPNRPEVCKDAYKAKKEECIPDVIAMFKEGNLIYI